MRHLSVSKNCFWGLAALIAFAFLVFGCSPSGPGMNANGPSDKFGDGVGLLDPGQGNDVIGGGNATDPTNGIINGAIGGIGGTGHTSDSTDTGNPINR